MRLPGFLHQKQQPFLTRIIELRDDPPYPIDDLVQALGLDAAQSSRLRSDASSADAADAAIIPAGGRNTALMKIGGYLRHKGLSRGAIVATLIEVNRESCRPPLDTAEVEAIAASVSHYPTEPDAAPAQWPPILLPSGQAVPDLPATLLPGWLGETAAAIAAPQASCNASRHIVICSHLRVANEGPRSKDRSHARSSPAP